MEKRHRWTDEEIISKIKERFQSKQNMNCKAVKTMDRKLYSASYMHFGGWDEALIKAGFNPSDFRLVRDTFSKEYIINYIQERNRNNIPINYLKVSENDNSIVTAARKLFGSWDNTLQAAGLDASKINKRGRTYTIEDAVKFAALKRGKCLSTQIKITRTTWLEWECDCGHSWKTEFDNIVIGHWCPYCKNSSMNEEKTRYIFEYLTQNKFPKNNKVLNNGQHLDGYCEELKVAFEYNGEQHYKRIEYYHKTQEEFEKRVLLDKKKKNICKKLKIMLIVVPFSVFNKNEELSFINNRLLKAGIKTTNIDEFNYDNFHVPSPMELCREFARKNNGSLISKAYLGSNKKMQWKCSKCGSDWSASWWEARNGRWCPKCFPRAIKRRYDHSEIVKLREMGYTFSKISRETGCDKSHAARICREPKH